MRRDLATLESSRHLKAAETYMCVLCPLPRSLLRTPWETELDLDSKPSEDGYWMFRSLFVFNYYCSYFFFNFTHMQCVVNIFILLHLSLAI